MHLTDGLTQPPAGIAEKRCRKRSVFFFFPPGLVFCLFIYFYLILFFKVIPLEPLLGKQQGG